MSRGRRAVTAGAFCRTAPAAALRGFANVPSPASSSARFSCSKSARGMKTSPRTSSCGAWASGLRSVRGMDPMGRAVGGDEVREFGLEPPELSHERVVFGVGDLGARLDIIEGVVVMDLLAQVGDPPRRFGPRHERKDSRSGAPRSLALDGARSYTLGGLPMARVGPPPKDTTASVQDYLAAIYDLQSSGRPVIGARLVKHMAISAPAVTEAIQRLSRSGYVRVGHGKELTLTPKGRQIAEVMARRHRLLERWLTDTLGLNWTDAHEEAHRLEHALSPRVENRLPGLLGMAGPLPPRHTLPRPGQPHPLRALPPRPREGGRARVVQAHTRDAASG